MGIDSTFYKQHLMKISILFFLYTIVTSCKAQVYSNNREGLDLEFLKNKGVKSYVKYDGGVSIPVDNVKEGVVHYSYKKENKAYKLSIKGDQIIGYKKYFEDKKSIIYSEYNANGDLVYLCEKSPYGYIIKEQFFDGEHQLVKTIDFDELYDFNFGNILHYMNKRFFDTTIDHYLKTNNKEIPKPRISRDSAKNLKSLVPELYHYDKLIWCLVNVEGAYNNIKGIYLICLDGQNGSELLVKKYVGKKSGVDGTGTYPNYELIFLR